MINKFKDFLKNKFAKKQSDDLTDQEELLEDDTVNQEDATNPNLEINNVEFSDNTDEEVDEFFQNTGTNSLDITNLNKLTAKERLMLFIQKVQDKFTRFKFKNPKDVVNKKKWQIPKIKLDKNAPLISPSFSRTIDQVTSKASREAIHQIGLAVLFFALTYTLGKITALVLKGEPNVAMSRTATSPVDLSTLFNPSQLNQVKSQDIFRTDKSGSGTKTILADRKCEVPERKSNLPIKLLNTVVLQDSIKSIASVQVRGGRALEEFRIGDEISNMAKIAKISRLEILVKNLENGSCESIVSDTKSSERPSPISVMSPSQSKSFIQNKKVDGIENVGNKFSIQKSLLEDKLKDIGSILTQARAVQMTNPDGSLSFKMTEIDPAGLFPSLGVQDGDIITSINGKPITNLNEVMAIFGRIKNLDQLSLGIKRDGAESTQEYSIKK